MYYVTCIRCSREQLFEQKIIIWYLHGLIFDKSSSEFKSSQKKVNTTKSINRININSSSKSYSTYFLNIGDLPMGTLETKAPPDEERNLSTRTQKLTKEEL